MEIIQKGSVLLTHMEYKAEKSSFFALISFLNIGKHPFCMLSGNDNILIKISDNIDMLDSTVLKTDYYWKDFDYDDNLFLSISCGYHSINIVFFKKTMLNQSFNLINF